MDSWDDKQTGQKRTRLRVVGESMQLLGGRPGGAGATTEVAGENPKTSAPPKASTRAAPDEDEIPFWCFLVDATPSSRFIPRPCGEAPHLPMNATEACIALNILPTVGPVRLRKLLEV